MRTFVLDYNISFLGLHAWVYIGTHTNSNGPSSLNTVPAARPSLISSVFARVFWDGDGLRCSAYAPGGVRHPILLTAFHVITFKLGTSIFLVGLHACLSSPNTGTSTNAKHDGIPAAQLSLISSVCARISWFRLGCGAILTLQGDYTPFAEGVPR